MTTFSWPATYPTRTAEWQCTRCRSTNRKLLPAGAPEGKDCCVTCGLRHVVRPGPTPVRWHAEPA